MKYKTLLFDADNTLLDFSKAEREALKKGFEEMGLPLSEALIKAYVKINAALWERLNRGELTREEIFEHRFVDLFKEYGIDKDGHRMEKLYRKQLNEGYFLIDGALELVKELSKTRRLYIITNGSKPTQDNRLLHSGLSNYILDAFISEAVGFNKPSEGFFDYVKKHIPNFSEKETLVIGDSLTSDILGGNQAGIDTCFYDREGKGVKGSILPTYTIKRLEDLYGII